MKPGPPIKFVPKGWGGETWIINNSQYCGKILSFKKGKKCSLHYHKFKTETFYLRIGRLQLRIRKPGDQEIQEFEMNPGDCFDVAPRTEHQMLALEDSELFEFSTQHFEDDSYRIEKGD
jgi:mannose-6-phosphate isomerase-like protein (cupin superfamily)